ncbi:MAG: AAA family ATPase, partial [Myxococcales bacterium]|nr:AAA family ATPase [Myxococcales bacterium]
MSGRPLLSPFGTGVRRYFDAAPAPEGAELLEPLEARLAALDLPEEVAPLAFELVRLAPQLDPGGRRGLLHVATVALLDLADGSTRSWVRGEGGRRHLERRLGALVPDAELRKMVLQDVAWVLEGDRARPVLAAGPEAHAPLVLEGEHLYLQRMLRLEDRLADALAARARAPVSPPTDALADVLARPSVVGGRPVTLSEEQEAAVRHALGRRLTVISGGPGTGKTSIVVALLRAWVRAGVATTDIALAAPTGKAAHRMAEAVRGGLLTLEDPAPEDTALTARVPTPATLHRLLGYLPSTGRFAHHEHNRLSERVIIVDEASMIDLTLMERLVRAVHPEAHLVLLGDAEQLPSVDAGAVLRDVR